MGSARKTRMAARAPVMAAPSPAVFLSHGRELMGNAENEHLLQQTVVARFHSLFGTSPILCIYQNSNLISIDDTHLDCLYPPDVHVYDIIIQRQEITVDVEKYINKKMFEYFYLFVVYSRILLYIRGSHYLFVEIFF
jgi:hypothetical protein